MIRFIVEKKFRDRLSGAEWIGHVTVDADVPPLESALGGGLDVDAYEVSTLIGAEIRSAPGEPT